MWEIEALNSGMPHWLDKRAELTPHRVAVIGGGETWTFKELAEKTRVTAGRLASLGVKPGDHVAVLMANGLHTIRIIHALSYLGAVLVPLNTRLAPTEITWQLDNVEATWLLYDEKHQKQVQKLREGNDRRVSLVEIDRQPILTFPFQKYLSLDQTHSIMYTSGTTGYPKGVILTYGNHWWSASGSVLNLGLQMDDRWLLCVPLFHMSGLSILMRSVIYGIAVVLQEQFDPEEANQSIMNDGVTLMSVVTVMLSRMIEVLGTNSYPAAFRCMLLGGGPAPQSLLETCKAKGIPVFQTYGLTETASQIVTLSPEESLRKLGSAGKPLFPAELRIQEGKRICKAKEEGEIVVRGPNVTQGYWKKPEATQQVIQDGWLHTGDIGYMDEEGFLYVLDRRKDLFISGGENVYPAEVEAVLLAHPAVAEAGVTGWKSEEWGHVPIGFVKVKKKVTAEELIHHCRSRLAPYKVPVRMMMVDELPRNAAGKLLRHRLPSLLPKG